MIESSKINDAVMEEIIPFIQEGVTEKQLAKKLDELFSIIILLVMVRLLHLVKTLLIHIMKMMIHHLEKVIVY